MNITWEKVRFWQALFVMFFAGGILFFVAAFVIEGLIGSPSSTSALILVFVVPYAIVLGLLGSAFGLLLDKAIYVIRKGRPLGSRINRIVLGCLFIIVIGISVVIPLTLQLKWEALNTPGVRIDLAIFTKMQAGTEDIAEVGSSKSVYTVDFSDRKKGLSFPWNSRHFIARFDEHNYQILDDSKTPFIAHDLKGYDYIRELQCLPFSTGTPPVQFLAVLAQLRATSGNSMLSVFSSDSSCVYQEPIQYATSLNLGKDPSNGETVLIVESFKKRELIYRVLPQRE